MAFIERNEFINTTFENICYNYSYVLICKFSGK